MLSKVKQKPDFPITVRQEYPPETDDIPVFQFSEQLCTMKGVETIDVSIQFCTKEPSNDSRENLEPSKLLHKI